MSSTPDSPALATTTTNPPTETGFTWTIDNFASLEQTRYDSPVFGNSSTKFFLAVHPKGSHSFWNTTHTLVYLYLKSCDSSEVVQLRYQLSVLDSSGDKCNTQQGSARFRKKQSKWSMEFNWQYNILRDYLLDPKSDLLTPDGKLKVYCKVDIISGAAQSSYLGSEWRTIGQVSRDLDALLSEEKLCDVSLVVGGQVLRAHKAILAARSPVFGAMFEHDTKEAQEAKVDITDLDLQVCRQLLRYIYTGRIPPLEQYAEDLLAAADKYQMGCLKCICDSYLCGNIANETVSRYLLQADMHSAQRLKAKCIEHITTYPNQVMATEGWKALAATRPELGIQLFAQLAAKTSSQ